MSLIVACAFGVACNHILNSGILVVFFSLLLCWFLFWWPLCWCVAQNEAIMLGIPRYFRIFENDRTEMQSLEAWDRMQKTKNENFLCCACLLSWEYLPYVICPSCYYFSGSCCPTCCLEKQIQYAYSCWWIWRKFFFKESGKLNFSVVLYLLVF